MKYSKIKSCISLYGSIDKDHLKWFEWFLYANKLTEQLGFIQNFIGVDSEKYFKSGKILETKRAVNRLKKAGSEHDVFSSMEIYSLPETFKQAAFDYFTYMIRYCGRHEPHHLTIILPSELFAKLDHENVIGDLKHFINFTAGQIYEMSVLENPLFYASKANPPSHCKSLKLISEF